MIEVIDDFSLKRNDIIFLWHSCFYDSPEYIKFFLDNCPDKVCITYSNNKKIVSMFFLIDSFFSGIPCKYLYAACTLPEYRDQGIMSKMIEYAKNYCKDNFCDIIVLVPASESLYDYYSKFGFETALYKSQTNVKYNGNLNTSNCKRCADINKINSIRNELIDSINSFRFSDGAGLYSIKEFFLNDGEALLVDDDNEKSLLLFSFSENNLIIKEFLSNKGLLSSVFDYLYKKYNVENIYIHNPIVYNNKDSELLCTKCGMAYFLNNSNKSRLLDGQAYAGMYLD